MSFKVAVLLLGLCLLTASLGDDEESQDVSNEVQPKEPQESTTISNIGAGNGLTFLRNWKPGRLMKLGRILNELTRSHESFESDMDERYSYRHDRSHRSNRPDGILPSMYYVDSQRTATRRESSLIVSRKSARGEDCDGLSSGRYPSTIPLTSESGASLVVRPSGTVQRELVTMMFESMLDSIVDSWEVIIQNNTLPDAPFENAASELTVSARKKKSIVKPTKAKKKSKLEITDTEPADQLYQSWWSSPDERAIIRFRNGNIYEGNISMKCMHGEGRFQWADGTVYLGQFKNNQMCGKGIIQWKDDTWYEGEFTANLRHGKGLYVDSRKQRSYTGGWHCGTKHGQGVIYYSGTFKNSYDGEWEHNVRHGFGSREYCALSGYKGEWDHFVRDGNGLMIWPNHDFYKGEWKNGVMSGTGIYIWNAYSNNSLSLPSLCAYRGEWYKGYRNGYGVLNLGLGLGSYYKGDFKENKKHGHGKFVTNNGMILYSKKLFVDDNIGPYTEEKESGQCSQEYKDVSTEPFKFDICDNKIGYIYHVHEAIENIDKQSEVTANIITAYIKNNNIVEVDNKLAVDTDFQIVNLDNLISFEEISLRKSLRCYESDLKNIYYNYATISNYEHIQFTPVLIRLYLWQLYYDCNIHQKGLTLVEVDKLLYRNRQWEAKSPHNPFEKIYFWQYLHSLISVASTLYAKRELPGPKPDTILANALRTFMEKDVLPNVSKRKGRLMTAYGQYIPLKGLYSLFRSINEPHTVRNFLCAIRISSHLTDRSQPPLVEASDECLPLGRNVYLIGDDMTFVADESLPAAECNVDNYCRTDFMNLKLFNFGNLSSRTVIKIFSKIFPHICKANKIMNLDIEMTFYEFFEAFLACAEESIRVKDEEMRYREKFSASSCVAPNSPTGFSKLQKQ